MEPTPAKPPRKRRRRWLIVAFVLGLVFVSLGTWWYWPRGDARFVGTWDAYSRDLTKPYARLTFFPHGVLHCRIGSQKQELHRWHVDGQQLFITGRRFVDWGSLQPVVNQLERWLGYVIDLDMDRDPLTISKVSPDEIVVSVVEQGTERKIFYRRIPE